MPAPITLKTITGHYLTAELDGSLAATRTEAGPWEQWTVEALESGAYALKSAHGYYLTAYSPEHCHAMGLPVGTVRATGLAVNAWEVWAPMLHGAGVSLTSCWSFLLRAEGGGGSTVDAAGEAPGPWEEFLPSDMGAFGFGGTAPGTGPMRPLDGEVRAMGHSFADASGPRIVHGCSDFGALAKYNQNRDEYLRQLDITAQYQQYTRIAWRLNGWLYEPSGLSVDPISDGWFEDALCGVLDAHQERGLKVNLSSFDMNNWSDAQMDEWFTRVGQIANDFGDVVWLSGCTNEMEGTWSPGETEDHIARGHELMQRWRGVYPRGMWAVSDPKDRNMAGMKALAGNCALIHDIRWEVWDCLRRTFNSRYENYPGVPIVQDEPTGPNGSPPYNDFTRHVYQPIEDHDELLAIYTLHILTGQASTYFNDPALVSREPLDSTWGFKELPACWREMEIPEDIGQGEPYHGGNASAMMNVIDSHASRADGMSRGNYHLGVISGAEDGQPWAVKARLSGTWSTWYAAGMAWEGHLSAGQVIPVQKGHTPVVVRCIT